MQRNCALLQIDNHTNTSTLNFTGWTLFLTPNQQCQSTDGTRPHAYNVQEKKSEVFKRKNVGN